MRRDCSRSFRLSGFLLGCLAVLLFMAKLVAPQMGHAAAMGAMGDDLMVICGSDGAKIVRILPNGDAQDLPTESDPRAPCPKCVICDWCVTPASSDTIAPVDMTFPKPEIGPQNWRIKSDVARAYTQLITPQVRGPPLSKPFSIWASLPRSKNALGHSSTKAPA